MKLLPIKKIFQYLKEMVFLTSLKVPETKIGLIQCFFDNYQKKLSRLRDILRQQTDLLAGHIMYDFIMKI